ncbi:MAG: ribosome maturation factor RimP, partial [candidate division Zixibacteria bacterium]|nr:ribosome maturation factor RimP [candidate division Zixibacteria bacterium]
MADSKLKEEIKKSVLSILTEEQLDLVEMKFSDLGPTWFLRIFIDRPGGVTVEDCAKVSQRIADCLDT